MNLNETRHVVNPSLGGLVDSTYSNLEIEWDAELGILWTVMNQLDVPCMTPQLLQDLKDHHLELKGSGGQVFKGEEGFPIRFSVLASRTPGIFNLGGQLKLFNQMIREQNRDVLLNYATACIDLVFTRTQRYELPLTTITLIQGDALGGGLEAALASDVIIAERSCTLGFPEILFNLFPGMGAYSLLARKVSPAFAEKLILDGTMYTAEELHKMGVVDVLAEDGQGVEAVLQYVKKHERRSNGFQAVLKSRDRFHTTTREELLDITTIWVDAALNLRDRDLRMMERFIRAQEKSFLK